MRVALARRVEPPRLDAAAEPADPGESRTSRRRAARLGQSHYGEHGFRLLGVDEIEEPASTAISWRQTRGARRGQRCRLIHRWAEKLRDRRLARHENETSVRDATAATGLSLSRTTGLSFSRRLVRGPSSRALVGDELLLRGVLMRVHVPLDAGLRSSVGGGGGGGAIRHVEARQHAGGPMRKKSSPARGGATSLSASNSRLVKPIVRDNTDAFSPGDARRRSSATARCRSSSEARVTPPPGSVRRQVRGSRSATAELINAQSCLNGLANAVTSPGGNTTARDRTTREVRHRSGHFRRGGGGAAAALSK